MTTVLQPLRSVANGLGLAWWARVESRQPDVTYWFGPYVRRSSLEAALAPFLADLRSEGAESKMRWHTAADQVEQASDHYRQHICGGKAVHRLGQLSDTVNRPRVTCGVLSQGQSRLADGTVFGSASRQ